MAFKNKNLARISGIDASKYNKALSDEIVSLQKDLIYYQDQDFNEPEILEVLDGNDELLLDKVNEFDGKSVKPKKTEKPQKKERAALVESEIKSCKKVISIFNKRKKEEELKELKAEALAKAKTSKEKREIESRKSAKDFEPKKTVPEVVEQRLQGIIEYVIQQRALTLGTEKKLRKKALKKTKDDEVDKVVNGIKQLILNESREAYTEIISKVI